jgi:transposase
MSAVNRGAVEHAMSNASNCRRAASHFARLAAQSRSAEEQRAYQELKELWSEMAALAERFDREHDGESKARIYAMIEEVGAVRDKVA